MMDNLRQPPLVLLAAAGFIVLLVQFVAPEYFQLSVSELESIVADLPEPVILGAITISSLAVWAAMLYVSGRVLYWTWKQIDEYVLSVWNLILPENPIVRFGAGVTLMIFLFIIAPMVVLQELNFFENDDVGIEGNETSEGTEPTPTPTPAENDSSERLLSGASLLVSGAERVG
jgi:hypothetical protein